MAVSENSPPTGRLSAPSPSGRRAALAQSAERFTRNEQVVGSIPTGGSGRSHISNSSDPRWDDRRTPVPGGEDPDPAGAGRIARRQHERGLREVELPGQLLHGRVG